MRFNLDAGGGRLALALSAYAPFEPDYINDDGGNQQRSTESGQNGRPASSELHLVNDSAHLKWFVGASAGSAGIPSACDSPESGTRCLCSQDQVALDAENRNADDLRQKNDGHQYGCP
jgi:hypothetical protein